MPTLRHSLRFIWLPAIAMALVVAALYLVVRWWVAGEIDASSRLRAEQRSLLLAGQLESSMETLHLQLRQLSRRLALRPLKEVDSLRADLEWLQARSQGFVWIGLVTPEGRVLAGTRGWLEGASLDERPVFVRAKTGPYLGDFHPALLLQPFLAASGRGAPSVADMGLPLFDAQGQLRAVLVAHISHDWLLSLGERLVSPPEQSRLGFSWFLLDSRDQALNGPPPFAMPKQASPWTHRVTGSAGRDRYYISGTPMSVGLESSALRWTAVVSLRETEAASTLRAFDRRLGVAALLAALLAAGLGFLVSRRLMRPYDRLLEVVGQRYAAATASTDFKGYLDDLSRELSAAGVRDDEDPESALLMRVARDASQLRHLLDSLPVAVCILGEGQRLLYANRLFGTLLGHLEAAEMASTLVTLSAMALPAAAASPAVARIPGPGARRMTVSCAPLRQELHQQPQQERVLVLRDVTDQVAAAGRERELQDERAALTRRLLQQEKEATRKLALSLHDELGQTVGAMRLLFDARVARLATQEGAQGGMQDASDIRRLDELLDKLHRQIRSVLAELRPPLLDEFGLVAALGNEVRSPELQPLRIRVDGPPDRRWPADVEWCAFLVAREALNNARRHAGANSVDILVKGEADALRVSVIDDGLGVEGLATRTYPGHLGLVGMRERAAAIGARLVIESSPDSGTEVTLEWGVPP